MFGDETPSQMPSTNTGCRILTISASLDGATSFITRVKSLSETASGASQSTELELPRSTVVPFTITNRYYRADVHFAAYELKVISPELFSVANASDYRTPPAVIFVWTDGEPYAKHVEELSRMMALREYEPEVCLAVRIPTSSAASPSPGSEPESTPAAKEITSIKPQLEQDENAEIDSTLMSFGFEYIDATIDPVVGASARSDSADDVPRLPRVLDALSTIMWPSMESASSSKGITTSKPNAKRDAERDSIMEELLAVSGISGISSADSRSRGGKESANMDEDEDEEDTLFLPYDFNSNSSLRFAAGGPSSGMQNSRPWLDTSPSIQISTSGSNNTLDATTDSAIVISPTDIESDDALLSRTPFGSTVSHFPTGLDSGSELKDKNKTQVSIGFEDDFTVFISASPTAIKPSSTVNVTTDRNIGSGLAPSSAAILGGRGHMTYRSLGSVSDFGGDDGDEAERNEYRALHDDEGHMSSADEDAEGEWEEVDEWNDRTEFEDGDDNDDEMPTKEEILATAAQIFGGSFPRTAGGFKKASNIGKDAGENSSANMAGPNPELEGKKNESDEDAATSAMLDRMRRMGSTAAASDIHAAFGNPPASTNDNDDDSDEDEIFSRNSANIDMERVLHGLQAMRTEIAGVQDEEERRRMASRVALGFVYGMDLDLPSGGRAGNSEKK